MGFKKISQSIPIRDQVADIIRRAIIDGELVGGQQITERFISEKLDISTTPVKEAFRTLHTEGLIYSLPRKGTFVSEFSKQSLEQVSFIRSALEGTAVYFAAQNISNEDIEKLEKVIEEAEEHLEQNDYEQIVNINTLFHEIIRNACKNTYLIQLISTLRSLDYSFRYASLRNNDERYRGFEEHKKILDALKRRDCDTAEKLMVHHIRRVAKYVLT